MDVKVEGRRAAVAGGGAGTGRATAERLAAAGVELVLSAIRDQSGRASM
jgi:3-oxoacyl-[acyl-carrier protein] reductase